MNNIKPITMLVILLFLCTSCYGTITGKVVDAETEEPIEGAVMLVEWTIAKGLPGLTYTKSYKVIEMVTDKEGKVTVSGVLNPMVDPPSITVYKKGYVAWNNKYIFPDYKKRIDFKWKNDCVVRLEHFKPEYTHDAHESFIRRSYSFGLGANSEFEKAWRWEALLAIKERQEKTK